MIPSWLSYTLERLPGRPRAHILLLMAVVLVIYGLSHIFKNSYLFMPLGLFLFYFVVKFDFSMGNKELVDLRDWIVVRAITSTFWISMALWIAARLLHGISGWDYLFCLFVPYIMYREGRVFLRVLDRAKELPDWSVIALVKRRKEEGQ